MFLFDLPTSFGNDINHIHAMLRHTSRILKNVFPIHQPTGVAATTSMQYCAHIPDNVFESLEDPGLRYHQERLPRVYLAWISKQKLHLPPFYPIHDRISYISIHLVPETSYFYILDKIASISSLALSIIILWSNAICGISVISKSPISSASESAFGSPSPDTR